MRVTIATVIEGCTTQSPTDPVLVDLLIMVTRKYLPYLRIIAATSGLYGRDYLIAPLEGVIAYDATMPIEDRYVAVERALHQLWEVRHDAGLGEYEHQRRPRLSAVS